MSRDTRQLIETRTLVDLTNVLSLFGTETILCVDIGTLQIIRQLLERAYWPTTYYHEIQGESYTLPLDSELDIIHEKLGDFFLESDKAMALCEDLNVRLQELTATIAAQQLCCPSPGSFGGFFQDEPIPGLGGQAQPPPTGWNESFYQPGTSEYYDNKCKAANYIADGLESILLQFSQTDIANIANTLGLGIAAGVLLAILSAPVAGPFAVLIGVIGAISAGIALFVGGGLNFTTLLSIHQNNRGAIICAMFEGSTAQLVTDNVVAVFAGAGATTVEQTFLRWLFDYSGASNTLFYKRDDIPPLPETVTDDCSNCQVTCPEYNIVYGTFVSEVSDVVTVSSQFVGGTGAGHWVSLHFGQDTVSGGQCGPASTVELTAINQSSNEPTLKAYRRANNHFLSGSGAANPNWTELVSDWSTKVSVVETGVRTLTLYKSGSTPFEAQIRVT